MRKTVNALGWLFVSLTILSLILTMLSTYQFLYIKYFNSYNTLQWCIFFTMIFWAIRLFDFRSNKKSLLNSLVCMTFAVLTMVFIYLRVY